MVHRDHVSLIEKAIIKGGTWADFGSGEGAFTLALRDLAGTEVEIYSVDADSHALQKQKNYFARDFPQTTIHYIHANFTSQLELPKLDGIIMVNSLHYLKNQVQFLNKVKEYLKPHGKLVLVEYNTNKKPSEWLADFYCAEATI